MDNTVDFLYEKEVLKDKIEKIKNVKEEEKQLLKVLPIRYSGNPFLVQHMLNTTLLNIDNIEQNLSKPYFARIDIEQNEKIDNLYIGKIGVIDSDGNSIVTDWRTPVASVYYDGNLGTVQYNAPGGIYKADLKLKRQIQIENQELISIYDVDSISDDELLKPYLSANMDGRLKNIIATIQKEQNEIIRENLNKNIIVQGVAGSGKTTVALHKIAYDVYNFSNKQENYRFMVIGPNKIFLKYISSVLPDLDTGGVKQNTLQEMVQEYIDNNIIILEDKSRLENVLNGNKYIEIQDSFKGSLAYKETLDDFLNQKVKELFDKQDDFYVFDVKIIDKEEIKEMYYLLENMSLNSKISYLIEQLSLKIINNSEVIYSKIWNILTDMFNREMQREKKEKLKKEMVLYKTKVSKGLKNELKRYFSSFLKLHTKSLYGQFLKEHQLYTKVSLEVLKNDKYLEEDIPALLYIEYYLNGPKEYENIISTVIDEAQDLSEFCFYVLNKILKKSNICIFGDLTQGIYSYKSINNWERLNEILDRKYEIRYLNKSYRNTIEIMEEANKISYKLGDMKAIPVIRHGDCVRYITTSDIYREILKIIKQYEECGFKSYGVITKTKEQASAIYEELKDNLKDICLLEENQTINDGKCKVIPSYLAKGLEFDAVIIVDSKTYDMSSTIEQKLLYVAYTRAMHKLDIIN